MPPRTGIRYRPSPYARPLFQGDIVLGVPVQLVPPSPLHSLILCPAQNSGLTREELVKAKQFPKALLPKLPANVPDAWNFGAEVVIAKAVKTPAMIVTQTCDLDNRNQYQIAPVRKLAELGPGKQESLRKEEIGYFYYLPGNPPVMPDDSFADLNSMTTVHKSHFRDAEVICRLTNQERAHFQSAVTDYLGSPFGYNTRDRVVESGRYGCLNCFFVGEQRFREFAAGDNFQQCEGCTEGALWVLING
jgi:hypothetical protein